MLTRNRALTRKQSEAASKLLNAGDFNVRVCVLDRTTRYYTEPAYRSIRADLVRKSLGSGILNSENQVDVIIIPSDTLTIQKYTCVGSDILSRIPRELSVSFRIDILKNNKTHSWIFLV